MVLFKHIRIRHSIDTMKMGPSWIAQTFQNNLFVVRRTNSRGKWTKWGNRIVHTMNGLTWRGFATKSEFGLKTNKTLSPHGVLVTYTNKSPSTNCKCYSKCKHLHKKCKTSNHNIIANWHRKQFYHWMLEVSSCDNNRTNTKQERYFRCIYTRIQGEYRG